MPRLMNKPEAFAARQPIAQIQVPAPLRALRAEEKAERAAKGAGRVIELYDLLWPACDRDKHRLGTSAHCDERLPLSEPPG